MAAVAGLCLVFAVSIAGDVRGDTARQLLLAEAAGLLPADARVLDVEYRHECWAFLRRESPACASVTFRVPGSAARRLRALVGRSAGSWRVTRLSGRDGKTLRMQRGDLRADATFLSSAARRRCRRPSLVRVSCEDSLLVATGPSPIDSIRSVLMQPAATGPVTVELLERARLRRVHLLRAK